MSKKPKKAKWMVIWKQETCPAEVFVFEEHQEKESIEIFNRLRKDWSDVYLCEVKDGPYE